MTLIRRWVTCQFFVTFECCKIMHLHAESYMQNRKVELRKIQRLRSLQFPTEKPKNFDILFCACKAWQTFFSRLTEN